MTSFMLGFGAGIGTTILSVAIIVWLCVRADRQTELDWEP